MDPKETHTEEVKITADKLVDTVKELLHETTVRNIAIKHPDGQTLLEIPVLAGIVGLLAAPILAPIAAIAVFAGDYTIVVTREVPPAA
jgi:hypothetical protein